MSGGSVLLAIVLCFFFLGQQEMTCYIIQPFYEVTGICLRVLTDV
jgi:hypothetical protein